MPINECSTDISLSKVIIVNWLFVIRKAIEKILLTLNSQVSCQLSVWPKIESFESQSQQSILRIGKLSKKQFRALKTKAELLSIFKYMYIIIKRQSVSIKAPKDGDRVKKKTFQKYSTKQ